MQKSNKCDQFQYIKYSFTDRNLIRRWWRNQETRRSCKSHQGSRILVLLGTDLVGMNEYTLTERMVDAEEKDQTTA